MVSQQKGAFVCVSAHAEVIWQMNSFVRSLYSAFNLHPCFFRRLAFFSWPSQEQGARWSICDKHLRTPLDWAIKSGFIEMVTLIEHHEKVDGFALHVTWHNLLIRRFPANWAKFTFFLFWPNPCMPCLLLLIGKTIGPKVRSTHGSTTRSDFCATQGFITILPLQYRRSF